MLNKAKLALLGGVAAVIAGLCLLVWHLDGEVDRLTAANATLSAANRDMAGKIETQNAAVKTLQEASNAAVAEAEKANREASALRRKVEQDATTILYLSIPKDCRGAVQWARDVAPGLSEGWR